MTDQTPVDIGQNTDPNAPQVVLQNIYLKDASFEAPVGPNFLSGQWEPKFNLNMNTAGGVITQDLHEVVLTITLEAKLGDNTAFLVEVKQAGLFQLRNLSQDDVRRVVGGFCPGVLFPYARQVVSDMITKGGFPPFLLPPVNFDALLEQQLAQNASGSAPAAGSLN